MERWSKLTSKKVKSFRWKLRSNY